MPILPIKNNPPSKSFELSILEKEGTWWVAKVKSRQEKAFAFDLLELGVDYCLPYYIKRTKRNDGTFRKSVLVLFPSYLPFISENPYEFSRHKRVEKILPVKLQQQFKKELNYLFLSDTSQILIEPILKAEPFMLNEPVEIIAGPLNGAKGIITSIQNKKGTIILTINTLGCVKVTVDAKMIRSENLAAASLQEKVYEKPVLTNGIIRAKDSECTALTEDTFSSN